MPKSTPSLWPSRKSIKAVVSASKQLLKAMATGKPVAVHDAALALERLLNPRRYPPGDPRRGVWSSTGWPAEMLGGVTQLSEAVEGVCRACCWDFTQGHDPGPPQSPDDIHGVVGLGGAVAVYPLDIEGVEDFAPALEKGGKVLEKALRAVASLPARADAFAGKRPPAHAIPLSDNEELVHRMILESNEPVTLKAICRETGFTEGYVTGNVILSLKEKRGLLNRRNVGYYYPDTSKVVLG